MCVRVCVCGGEGGGGGGREAGAWAATDFAAARLTIWACQALHLGITRSAT